MLETKVKKKKGEGGGAGREEREAAAAEHKTPSQDLLNMTTCSSVTIIKSV